MVHPNVYSSGKVLPRGRVEFGAQFFPGATLGVGMGKGTELRANFGYTGDDITGGGFEFCKELYHENKIWISGSAGADWFNNSDTSFSGHRIMFGGTLSWYPVPGRVGLHFPMRGYYMTYKWDWASSTVQNDTGDGYVFVPGMGLSVEGRYLAWKLGFNAPSTDYIGRTELLPTVGTQISVRF